MLWYILYRTTVKGVTPQLCFEWTQAYKQGGRRMCWIQYNYTGNWACFIDCERARPVTKPPSVSMVCLKGGGGRMAHLSLDQSHTWSWRIKLAVVRNNCNSNFQRYSVHVYLTEGMDSFCSTCHIDFLSSWCGRSYGDVFSAHWFMCYKCLVSNFQKCWTGLYQSGPGVLYQGLLKDYMTRCCCTLCVCTNQACKFLPWQQFQSNIVEKVFWNCIITIY